MKTYLNSTTENKTQIKLLKLKAKITTNQDLRKYLEITLNQIFEDKELFLKQKAHAFKNVLKGLKENEMVDEKLVYTINLLIRNINSFVKIQKQEVKTEDGKSTNFIPTTNYQEILQGLIMLTFNSSFSKIVKESLGKQKAKV